MDFRDCGDMEGMMFSTSMIISPVDVEPQVSEMDDIMENSVAREFFVMDQEPIPEPYIGMEFESEENARSYYSSYASQMGFKVRVSSFIRSKRDKTIISRQLVCSREGFRTKKEVSDDGACKRPRAVSRVGCRAMIMVKKDSSGKWVVSKLEKIHNHVLGTQGKVVMLDINPYTHENEAEIENPAGVDADYPEGGEVYAPLEDLESDPYLGMEFEYEKDAKVFYKAYARRVGFRARVSSYYRSKRDNSIISRLIVCSKEGFRSKKHENNEDRLMRPRIVTRVGCKAMIMVKKRETGKWVVSKLVKNHNHALTPMMSDSDDEACEEEDVIINDSFNNQLSCFAGDEILEPCEGMEFDSEEAARMFYLAYSRHVGFNMRVSTYYRSKRDKSVISRLFVCSKEGFYSKKGSSGERRIKRPREATRVGCKAMLMVKKNNLGKWVVSKFEREHNHALGSLRSLRRIKKRKRLSSMNTMSMAGINDSQSSASGQESSASRYNNLCREAIKYAQEGAASADVYNVAMQALREAVKKVTAMKKNIGEVANDGASDESLVSSSTSHTVQHHKLRLCDSNRQLKHPKSRICDVCHQPSDHTSRNCPMNQLVMSPPGPMYAFAIDHIVTGPSEHINVDPREQIILDSVEPISQS